MFDKQTVILVVDDFEPMRKIAVGQLRGMGATAILTAANGAEALRILREQQVDIVLSDWNMPVMSGLELLKAMRADSTLAALPFIMITAEAEHHRMAEAIAGGVSDLLIKPYTAGVFTARVEKALRAPPRAAAQTRATLAARRTPAPVAPAPVRPTILVVDDTPDNLVLLSHLFEDEYRVQIADSGSKALAICQSDKPPDLVLLDIMMPGMDGFEVARAMRAHPASETIPVIFVTAMSGDDTRLKGLELGAVDFVTKPIDPGLLKPRVRNFMRYVKLHKQLQANYDCMKELAQLREDVEHITRHDMKGPLAGVIGLVQALADDSAIGPRQLGQLRIVEQTALQVLDMINLSSELFKIETGRFKLHAKPVRIEELLHRVVGISRATYAAKQLSVVLAVKTEVAVSDEVARALGDSMLCYSLFQNLLKNACEAAPENSRVAVTLIDAAPLRVMIENTGAVPKEIRASFFGKFVTHGKPDGTGLGAYSAKLLAEAQNGAISLEVYGEESQTRINVTLPRYSEATA